MHRLSSLLLALALTAGLFCGVGHAQIQIHGRVTDAKTGEPLPQANLQIEGTYTGTVTNDQGRYSLEIERLPATILVRYIGYKTDSVRVTTRSAPRQNIELPPSTVAMQEVVVTGSENPGRAIMKKVIDRKQTWWDSLATYQVDAYSRYTLSNDTGIVSIYETQTRAFWNRDEGTREVVTARRQTDNLGVLDDALPAASSVLNLYRDNVTVAGSKLMGVTHPDALDRYAFRLDTTRALDGRTVYEIQVRPKRRLTSAFVGEVSVLDSAYAMIDASLRPARSLRLPRVIKNRSLAFEQQFSNFGGRYWLPVNFRAERQFEVELSAFLTFPRIHLDQSARLSGYEINVPLPDSLFQPGTGAVVEGNRVRSAPRAQVDSVGIDSLGTKAPFIPLSDAQERAYARRDSLQTLGEAFQPSGLLGGLLDLRTSDGGMALGTDSEERSADTSETATDSTSGATLFSAVDVQWPRPHVWYNRVEGPHVGGEVRVDTEWGVTGAVRGGHSFFLEHPTRWSYGATIGSELPLALVDRVVLDYRYGVDPRYEAQARLFPPVTRGINTMWTIFGEPDYYDYFGNERLRVGVVAEVPNTRVEARLQYRTERQFSVTEVSDYNVLGRSSAVGRATRQPPNPQIDEGHLRSLHLTLEWGDNAYARGIFPIDRVVAEVEHSGEWLGSEFSFTHGEVEVDTRVETFFRRRVLPNTLDLRIVAGGTLGTLPLQRFGVVEASPLPYTPFGALRTLDDRPYQGTAHAAAFWEHNFRTIPFELLGLYGVADRHIELIVHGGHARTWIDAERELELQRRGTRLSQPDGVHHELGVSVNGLLKDLIRVDVTARLDRSAYSVGVSLLRFI